MSERDENEESDSGIDSGGFDMDQIVVSRDDQGLIVPEETYVEEFDDTVVARPLNKDGRERYIQPFLDSISTVSALVENDVDITELDEEQREEIEAQIAESLTDEQQAELFDSHIVEPDLVAAYQANYPKEEIDELDERFIKQDLKPGAVDGLMYAILQVSDMEELADGLRRIGELEEEEAADEEDPESGNSEPEATA